MKHDVDDRVGPGDEPASDEFQLPLLGLYADLELGTGSVSLPDEFTQLPQRVQLGILRDWQGAFERLRGVALMRLYRDIVRETPALGREQHLERWRQACAELGIDAPAEVPAASEDGD